MTAKEYLQRFSTIKINIELANEQLIMFRNLAEKITAESESTSRSTTISDKVGKNAARIADLENEIQDKITVYISQYKEIMHVISQVSGIQQRQVLEAVYINNCKIHEAADKIGYSYSQTERYHIDALEQVEKILIKYDIE